MASISYVIVKRKILQELKFKKFGNPEYSNQIRSDKLFRWDKILIIFFLLTSYKINPRFKILIKLNK